MKFELAMRLAEGIHLLHLDGNLYYTNKELANAVGTSPSTIKRHQDFIKALDVALHLMDEDDGAR